jgi:hypothetical protein
LPAPICIGGPVIRFWFCGSCSPKNRFFFLNGGGAELETGPFGLVLPFGITVGMTLVAFKSSAGSSALFYMIL